MGDPGGTWSKARTCHVELGEGVACGRAHGGEEVGRLVREVVAVAEVEAGEQGHMADDQAQRGVRDVQPGEPEVDHVAEFAAIVLTCTGKGRNGVDRLPWGPSLVHPTRPQGSSSLLGLSVGGVSKSRI